ncbi:hypothetical protein Cgig2_024004 [Carnegiea gigantea]|uniref:CCT domain-containing protein n=1 Tax=Carnegiea gigantea TaxID=171969 RepID=A0A9Q1KB42_9CARY|nr:hypothetical protein Cgig2_024004 [Carnegiea gigantea]
MYGHFNSLLYDNNSTGYLSQSYPSHFSPFVPQSCTNGDFDSIAQPENGNGSSNSVTSNSYVGSPSSPLSCCTSSHPHISADNMIQRSLSSHSVHKNGLYPPVSSPSVLHDLDISPVRRVFSTGDLDKGVSNVHHHQHRERSPLANESTSIILEGMTRACPYNPEEKRERIERYRSKRSQRNFNKKIQYACRKTLADSRPRIRGRFARNDEIEKTNYSPEPQWNQMTGEEDDEDEEQWIHLLDSFASNLVP